MLATIISIIRIVYKPRGEQKAGNKFNLKIFYFENSTDVNFFVISLIFLLGSAILHEYSWQQFLINK